MPSATNARKKKAARKLRRWKKSVKAPRFYTEKHWRARVAKGRMRMRRLKLLVTVVPIVEDGRSFLLTLGTWNRIELRDWTETTTYSTVRVS